MTSAPFDTLSALLRQDFRAFIEKVFVTLNPGQNYFDNWHIGAIAEALRRVHIGETKRLIITMPPRHLKSLTVSVAFSAWALGLDPSKRIIGVSYSSDLEREFSRHVRRVLSSDWYRRAFPATRVARDKNTETQIHTTRRGFRLATTVGGPLTGFGGNLILLDDPIKADEARSETERNNVWTWFTQTLLSRLDNKARDAIVLVMQRLHEDDPAGRLLAQGGWEHLSIPAEADRDRDYQLGPDQGDRHTFKAGTVIDPQREPKFELDRLRRAMGTAAYSAQYLQSPVPAEGTLFRWDWIRFYERGGAPRPDYIFMSWDTASAVDENASYSVCTVWGVVDEEQFYLLDVFRARLDFPALLTTSSRLFGEWRPDLMLIEAVGTGRAFFEQLRERLGARVVATNPRRSKLERAEAITPLMERGCVHFPSDAPFLDALRNELMAFPSGRHDDQVDSIVQFLEQASHLVARADRLGRLRHTGRRRTRPEPRRRDGSVLNLRRALGPIARGSAHALQVRRLV